MFASRNAPVDINTKLSDILKKKACKIAETRRRESNSSTPGFTKGKFVELTEANKHLHIGDGISVCAYCSHTLCQNDWVSHVLGNNVEVQFFQKPDNGGLPTLQIGDMPKCPTCAQPHCGIAALHFKDCHLSMALKTAPEDFVTFTVQACEDFDYWKLAEENEIAQWIFKVAPLIQTDKYTPAKKLEIAQHDLELGDISAVQEANSFLMEEDEASLMEEKEHEQSIQAALQSVVQIKMEAKEDTSSLHAELCAIESEIESQSPEELEQTKLKVLKHKEKAKVALKKLEDQLSDAKKVKEASDAKKVKEAPGKNSKSKERKAKIVKSLKKRLEFLKGKMPKWARIFTRKVSMGSSLSRIAKQLEQKANDGEVPPKLRKKLEADIVEVEKLLGSLNGKCFEEAHARVVDFSRKLADETIKVQQLHESLKSLQVACDNLLDQIEDLEDLYS